MPAKVSSVGKGAAEQIAAQKDITVEESLSDESADRSSAETVKEAEEMTAAIVEKKMIEDIKGIVAAEFSEVNPYPFFYNELTKFLF